MRREPVDDDDSVTSGDHAQLPIAPQNESNQDPARDSQRTINPVALDTADKKSGCKEDEPQRTQKAGQLAWPDDMGHATILPDRPAGITALLPVAGRLGRMSQEADTNRRSAFRPATSGANGAS